MIQTVVKIAEKELLKTGMKPECAEAFAKTLFIGFPKLVLEKYGKECFAEGARQQKEICGKTKLMNKYFDSGMDLMRAVKHEIVNAPEPDFK